MNNEIGIKTGVSPPEPTSPVEKIVENKLPELPQAKPAEPKESQAEDVETIAKEVATDLNNLVQELHRELQFSVDHESGETVIKVIDQETDEIVRQIPSEEVVRMRKRLQEAAGLIFRDSA